MKKPTLVIMAAGMGSRYGGLKQIDPVDNQGHIIIDFSIFDAKRAGFEKVVFIIKKENEADFKTAIGDRISKFIEVEYVYQDLSFLPEGYKIPEGRVKPFGTAHAVLSCIHTVNEPFAIINADDYYGQEGFKVIYDYLSTHEDDDKYRYAMVGYQVENTLTDHGSVARGVCVADSNDYLVRIDERTQIEKKEDGAAYTEDGGQTWTSIPKGSIVSMNLFGFSASILKELELGFPKFLDENLEKNPLKCEYFIPSVITELLEKGKATVEVLKSADKWYGVTYKEDKAVVMNAIADMKAKGLYPAQLWEE